MLDFAQDLINQGYAIIPVKPDKSPACPFFDVNKPFTFREIKKFFKQYKDEELGIGLLMGGEKKLTGLDFDLKYDTTGTLFQDYKDKVDPELLLKMQVNTTKNQGYHFIFTCDVIEASQVLASRPTTNEEVRNTLIKNLHKEKFIDTCLAAANDRNRVLIETRGHGGYVVYPPSYGYSHIYGSINKISFIEYEILMETARSFNLFYDPIKRSNFLLDDEEDLMEAFNQKNNGLDILLQYGWEVVDRYKQEVRLRRPGDTFSKSSAVYHSDNDVFVVFSTSTPFVVRTSYRPFDIMLILGYNNNFKEFKKDLCK